jgi:hypothetical protein
MGRALHARLKAANENWKTSNDDGAFVDEVGNLLEQFSKQEASKKPVKQLSREDLQLICFEFVSG